MNDDPPSQQIDDLKGGLFTYIILAPLVAALFAERIDNVFVACVLFVSLVGTAYVWLRTRLEQLERSVREQEDKLEKLTRRLEFNPQETTDL
jgi:hypothetical protein